MNKIYTGITGIYGFASIIEGCRQLLDLINKKARRGENKRQRIFGLLAVVFLILSGFSASAQATYATGGTGLYKNNILWLTWGGGVNGTDNIPISSGTTTSNIDLGGGNTLVLTRTVSGIGSKLGGGLKSYRTGNYGSDHFDDLYNISGTGASNQLIAGIENDTNADSVWFTLTLSATLNGAVLKIPSIVMADAETTDNNEHYAITGDGNFSLVDRFNWNATPAAVSSSAGLTTFAVDGPGAFDNNARTVPIVALNLNSTAYSGVNNQVSLKIVTKGWGLQAVAIGVIIPFDYGDAPTAAYGTANNYLPQRFNSTLPVGATDLYTYGPLATPIEQPLFLGNSVDADAVTSAGNTTATQDDITGINDEDGVSTIPVIVNNGSLCQTISSYSITTTVTNNSGSSANIVAWIDWNNDGVFSQSEAITGSPVADGSNNISRTFTWTNVILSGANGTSRTYLRIRLSSGGLSADTPSGFEIDGETEDYAIPVLIVLPVKLINFSAMPQNNKSLLTWEVTKEAGVKQYEVQHSFDGNNFTSIGTVPAVGNTKYTFTDMAPVKGVNYYRLKMIDTNGSIAFSTIASVKTGTEGRLSVTLNNPFVSDIDAHVNLKENSTIRINIFDMAGKCVYSRGSVPGKIGLNQFHIDNLANLSAGAYMLAVTTDSGIARIKLIKQ